MKELFWCKNCLNMSTLLNRKIKLFKPKNVELLIVDSYTGGFFSEIITTPSVGLLNTSDYIYFNFHMPFQLLSGRLSISRIKNRYKEYLVLSQNPIYTISFSDCDAYSIAIFNNNKFNSGVVQIGLRGSLAIDFSRKSSFNCYYCFGENVKKFFIENDSKIKKYKIIGSVKNNHYWHVLRKKSNFLPDRVYDYCLLSSYRESLDENSAEYINFVHMVKFLVELVAERKVRVSIIIHPHQVTAKNTKKLLSIHDKDNLFSILESKDIYDSYFNLEVSKVLLSSGSSLGHEAFSQGKRVLFYNFTKDKDFDFPSRGGVLNKYVKNVLLKSGSYDALCKKIDNFEKISNKDWKYIVENVARKEVYFNEKNNPNSILIEDIYSTLTD